MRRPSDTPRYPDDVTKRAASLLRLTGIAGAALLATGCGVFSPVQTDYPYIPADGVKLVMPGLTLNNLVIVSDAKGQPGTLVGQAVNESSKAVDVSFGLEGSQTATAAVPAFSGTSLSAGSGVPISTVPAEPGALVELNVATAEAGRNVVLVPVIDRRSYYDAVPLPSGSASPSESPSASPSPSPSASPSS